MAVRQCAYCTRNSKNVYRVLCGVNIIVAIILLALGANVQFPIRDFPAVAMILMGVLALCCSIIGLLGSNKWDCCLTTFLGLHGLNVCFLIGLLAVMFFNPEGFKGAVHPQEGTRHDASHVSSAILGGKVVLLLFLPFEMALEVLAIMLTFYLKEDNGANVFNNFDEANMQERTLSMHALRTDIEAGRTVESSKTSLYSKVSSKMASKYGQFSQGFKWKKGWW